MGQDDKASENRMEYFRALRTEIIEAQKLRVQVGLAKTVFLGSLLSFFLKVRVGDSSILICPVVALMFDCMVYGLSFNISEVGFYIRDQIECHLDFELPWQTYRANRRKDGFKDWGRIVFRVGNYGLSAVATVVAFVEGKPPAGTHFISGSWIWRIALTALLAISWGVLICAEFLPIKKRVKVS